MKAPRGRPRSSLCKLVVLLGAVLLLPAPQQQRFARSQGLDVAAPVLLGGSELTAAEFLNFEDILSLSAQNLGGRGRGGRGGSGNLGGGAYRSDAEFKRLRTSVYYIGASPEEWESLRDIKLNEVIGGRNVTLGDKITKRNQGVICNSCVGQALASAIEIALTTTLTDWRESFARFGANINGENTAQFDIDARALYYCTKGGRTCKTGWDIPAALDEALNEDPKWLRPNVCVDGALFSRPIPPAEEAIDDWTGICNDASRNRTRGQSFQNQNVSSACFQITYPPLQDRPGQGPLYSCTYSSLSNFWQIQRHIRNHGSVVTRVYMPDDFEIFLNETARDSNGYRHDPTNLTEKVWKPYDFNATAKPAFGHAALIVGYDNKEYTWTILNSWGNSTDPGTRTKGITRDGTFKVRMGLLGIGTPEATYGVQCLPAASGPLDPNGRQAWLEDFEKRWQRIPGTENNSTGCLLAQARLTDPRGLFSFMDFKGAGESSSIDIDRFMRDNYRALGYLPKIFNYKYSYRMTAQQLYNVWKVVTDETRQLVESVRQGCADNQNGCNRNLYPPNPTHPWPHLECTFWTKDGTPTFPVQCPSRQVFSNPRLDIATVRSSDFNECGMNGTVACTLFYTDVDVTKTSKDFSNLVIQAQLCNPEWPPFDGINAVTREGRDPTDPTQPDENVPDSSSLSDLLDNVDGNWRNGEFQDGGRRRRQQQGDVTFRNITRCYTPNAEINKVIVTTSRTIDWYMKCKNYRVEKLRLQIRKNTLEPAINYPGLDNLVAPLRRLNKLKELTLTVYDGSRLGDLVVLQDLTALTIYDVCVSAVLPANLISGLPQLSSLILTSNPDWVNYTPRGSASLQCGWTGAVPEFWATNSNITVLNMTGNQLSGALPNTLIVKWRKLDRLLLGGNTLSGRIPLFSAWTEEAASNASIAEIDFAGNNFQGDFPNAWKAFRGRLGALRLDNIAGLTGCVPLDDRTDVTITGTRLAICNFDEEKQVEAVTNFFVVTLGSGTVPEAYRQLLNRTVTRLQGLGTLVQAPLSGACRVAYIAESLGPVDGSVNVTVENCGEREYITAINATNAGVNLSALVNLAKGLPQLSGFACERCTRNAASRQVLPAELQAAAPSLTRLYLKACAVVGRLPSEWGDWGQQMRIIDLSGNVQLNGTVPGKWSAGLSQCLLDVNGTGITGCEEAGGLYVLPENLPGCLSSSTSSELDSLRALHRTLTSYDGRSAELDMWDFENALGPEGKKYCNWPGLACTDNVVTEVDLSALSLTFPVSPPFNAIVESMLPGLENVTSLIFRGLGVGGPIPDLLLDFELLETLDISNNTGVTGDLPEVLAGLTLLKYFWLSGCPNIVSQLPVAYAALIELVEFRAADCPGLNGTIPAEWALLKNLKVLELSGTSISGPIPDLSINPPQAAALLAKTQAAIGPADGVVAAAAPSRQEAAAKAAVRIAAKLKVQQANDMPGLTSLEELILQNNQLSGPVPASLGRLLNLRVINLSGNGLQGPLPTAWSQLNRLQDLCVSYNDINGTLPRAYNRLSQLQKFDVAYNRITGSLPDIYVSLRNLVRLDVSYNTISGNVPNSWRNFGGRTYKLMCLSVASNPGLNLATVPDFTNARRRGIKVRKLPADPVC